MWELAGKNWAHSAIGAETSAEPMGEFCNWGDPSDGLKLRQVEKACFPPSASNLLHAKPPACQVLGGSKNWKRLESSYQ